MGLSSAAKTLTQEMYDQSINYGGAFLYMAYEPRNPGWDVKKDGTPTTYTVKLDQRYIDPLIGDYIEGEVTLSPVSGNTLLIKPSF